MYVVHIYILYIYTNLARVFLSSLHLSLGLERATKYGIEFCVKACLTGIQLWFYVEYIS